MFADRRWWPKLHHVLALQWPVLKGQLMGSLIGLWQELQDRLAHIGELQFVGILASIALMLGGSTRGKLDEACVSIRFQQRPHFRVQFRPLLGEEICLSA